MKRSGGPIISMIQLQEIDRLLGEKIRTAMKKRAWSSRTVSDEIKRAGGKVAYATIDNIAQTPTKSEVHKVYWVLRVLGISLGEAFDFTVEHEDERAHRMLATALRLEGADRDMVLEFLKYILGRTHTKQNLLPGA